MRWNPLTETVANLRLGAQDAASTPGPDGAGVLLPLQAQTSRVVARTRGRVGIIALSS